MVEYTAQSMVLAIIPKVPALCSMIGSTYIVHNVITVPQKRKTMYNRIMLGMSVCDILASHAYFLGTFIIPRGSGGPFGPVYWAFGNDATCSYGGFFNQFAVSSPIYNTSLSIYYLLQIVCTWTPKELERVEPVLHGFPIAFAIATSIYALVKDMYGNVFWTCWINPDPPQPKFRYFQWSFLFAPVWICVIINSVIMAMLWYKMQALESKLAGKYQLEHRTTSDQRSDDGDDSVAFSLRSGRSGSNKQRKSTKINMVKKANRQSAKIAVQGMLYVGAFYVTWFFPTVSRITDLMGTGYFAVQALDTGLLPLQGLLNVLVYLRPKYLFYRQKYPTLSLREIFKILNDPRRETVVVMESNCKQSADSMASSAFENPGGQPIEFNKHSFRETERRLYESATSEMIIKSLKIKVPTGPTRSVSFVDDLSDSGDRLDSSSCDNSDTEMVQDSLNGAIIVGASGTTEAHKMEDADDDFASDLEDDDFQPTTMNPNNGTNIVSTNDDHLKMDQRDDDGGDVTSTYNVPAPTTTRSDPPSLPKSGNGTEEGNAPISDAAQEHEKAPCAPTPTAGPMRIDPAGRLCAMPPQ